jgi:hypothetical protein
MLNSKPYLPTISSSKARCASFWQVSAFCHESVNRSLSSIKVTVISCADGPATSAALLSPTLPINAQNEIFKKKVSAFLNEY